MRVVSLWRFPVKSMQGEELESADVSGLGIAGDRQWALVDLGTGLALTARRVPELLFASARLVGTDEIEITLPDGTVGADDAALSRWLGRDEPDIAEARDAASREFCGTALSRRGCAGIGWHR